MKSVEIPSTTFVDVYEQQEWEGFWERWCPGRAGALGELMHSPFGFCWQPAEATGTGLIGCQYYHQFHVYARENFLCPELSAALAESPAG